VPLYVVAFNESLFHHYQTTAPGHALGGRRLGRLREIPAQWGKKLNPIRNKFLSKPTAGQTAVGFLFRRLWLAPTTPSHMTTIEIPTRMPEPATVAVPANGPGHRVGMLTRAYREAGLSIEAARRCALADFRCCFPQYLAVV
jgi:hypothetical protein